VLHSTIVASGCQNRRVTAQRPAPTTLTGEYIRLEPVEDRHLTDLFEAIGNRTVFEFGFGGGLAALPADLDEFRDWFARTHPTKNNTYVVVLVGGPRDGQVVGTTTLGDFDEHREAAHIGWTGYDPRVWGTAVNPEAKLLLLRCAFDAGFGRVKIQTDVLNLRSRAAIEGIGATFEGVVRREQPRPDGTWRDTAQYAVIVDEWPEVRAGLEKRLAAFGGRPVLFRTPRT
jgi:RimJ/RimL family protein N-acetyltransferase